MPKVINRVSPFHSSVFVTNVGSIGLSPIYHHLYEFGTTSVFMAIGRKEVVNELQRDGSVKSRHVINMRFVLDERICDGYYFASAASGYFTSYYRRSFNYDSAWLGFRLVINLGPYGTRE